MKKRTHEHPEITEIENICDTVPDDKSTKDVCDKISKEKVKKTRAKPSLNKKEKKDN